MSINISDHNLYCLIWKFYINKNRAWQEIEKYKFDIKKIND